MFDSKFLTDVDSRILDLETNTTELSDSVVDLASSASSLEQNMNALVASGVKSFTVTTATDGTATVDYSALKLTVAPKVITGVQLATDSDIPVFLSLVGKPTLTSAKVSVKKLSTIASLGLVPSYSGVANLSVDVYIKPQT